MAKGQLMMPRPLDPMLTLMLMPGTDTAATTAMDTGLMDTDTGTARGQLMRRPLLPDPTLMLRLIPMDGTAMDTATPTDTDTTTARGQLMMLLLLDPTLMLMLTLIPGTDTTATATPTTDMASAVTDTGDTTERNKKSEILLKMDF